MLRSQNPFYLLCHVAFWFPSLFATPLFLALKNFSDIHLSLSTLIIALLLITVISVALSYALGHFINKKRFHQLSLLLLAIATVIVIQGNIVHELFYYGEFNGQKVEWRSYGWLFWLEFSLYIFAIPAILILLLKLKKPSVLIPSLLIGSSILLFVPSLLTFIGTEDINKNEQPLDNEVFTFSSKKNLIHLLPDGFQADIVKEVLKEQPEIAAELEGFTFFDNHVGQFQGTAPTVPTIFNGQVFNLSEGYKSQQVKENIDALAYQNQLANHDYRIDFVSINKMYCVKEAESCVARPFNDLKPRGYFKYRNASPSYTLRLLADLSLFRHLPMFLKERVYREGNWFISDTTLDGSYPYPDPVIREWSDNIKVFDGPPRYKWYHFIGTHIPAQWNADCDFIRDLEHSRENLKAQTICVLTGLTQFLKALKMSGIYDKTSIIITGDHGCNIEANDTYNEVVNSSSIFPAFIGHARPAFMVKELNNREPLRFSNKPTSMIDVAPTALDLVGINSDYDGESALALEHAPHHSRSYQWYNAKEFWSGNPIEYTDYEISGDVKDAASWNIIGIHNAGTAPSEYPQISSAVLDKYFRGLRLDEQSETGKDAAQVFGSEFVFLISQPEYKFNAVKMNILVPGNIKNQTISLSINDSLVIEDTNIKSSGDTWKEVTLPIQYTSFNKKNNFVRVMFGKTDKLHHYNISAKIRSIELIP